MAKFLQDLQLFVNDANVQTIFTLITVACAFISCLLTYRLSRPNVKAKVIKNPKRKGGKECIFAYGNTGPLAVINLSFENCKSHKTQIKDIFFIYKRKSYHVADIFHEYPAQTRIVNATSTNEFSINTDLLFSKVPFDMDSFCKKTFNFTFYDFPTVEEDTFYAPLLIRVVGKKFPILKVVTFTKVPMLPALQYEMTVHKNGISAKISSSVPLKNSKGKVVSRRKSR